MTLDFDFIGYLIIWMIIQKDENVLRLLRQYLELLVIDMENRTLVSVEDVYRKQQKQVRVTSFDSELQYVAQQNKKVLELKGR